VIRSRLRWAVRRALIRTRPGTRLWWRWQGLRHELDFWSDWFELRGGPRWADDYLRRTQPAPLIDDPLVTARLDEIPRVDVRILDVGAGPLTRLGTRYPGKRIDLVAADPLAEEYDVLLRRFGIEPAVRTIEAPGERLLERFPRSSFDIAYAVNSIDHSYEPLRIVENMLALVRPDGVVLLRHTRNEGEHRRFSGPHQWNFDFVDGDIVIWNHAVEHSLGRALGARADVQGWIEHDEVLVRIAPREVEGSGSGRVRE
jgi:SAM-dependent methyltransferase